MLSLDEAIKRYTDNAEYERTHGNLQGCLDFRQLAEWLKKLQAYEEAEEEINRKMKSGQWSDAVVFGMGKALLIMRNHIREVTADECNL